MTQLQFPYFGEIQALHDTLERFRPALSAAFQQLYGDEMMEIIRQAEDTLLDENSFIKAGIRSRLGHKEHRTNSFVMAIGQDDALTIEDDGHFTTKSMWIAPMFCFSESALANKRQYAGWVDHILGAYVHEYNHFAMFALQSPRPMGLLEKIAIGGFKPKNWPLMPEDMIEMVAKTESYARKLLVAKLASFVMMIHNTQEVSTRKIDEAIFTNLGCTVPKSYHGPDIGQGYIPMPIPEIKTIAVFAIGAVLINYNPQERILILRDWATIARPFDQTHQNFLDSFLDLEVEIMPVTKMLELAGNSTEGQALQYYVGKRDALPAATQ